MLQTADQTRLEEYAYTFIGDSGAVSSDEFAAFLGVEKFRSRAWLRSRAAAGYLFQDEFGGYRTSCPWPRSGF